MFYRHYLTKKKFALFLFLICLYFVSTVYSGARINLFAVVIILLYYAYKNNNKRLIALSIGAGVFALVLLPAIGVIRGESSISLSSINTQSTNSDDVIKEIFIKTNSVNTSTSLIEHDGIGGGGPLVYMSTAFALVPRTIMPNKPHPGSKDGTLYGLPSRLAVIYSVSGDYNGISNVGISSSIEVLWAVGWLGLILMTFITSYSLHIFNQMLSGGKLLFIVFFLMLINFPVCQIDVPLSTLLISIQRYFMFTIFLYLIFNKKRLYET